MSAGDPSELEAGTAGAAPSPTEAVAVAPSLAGERLDRVVSMLFGCSRAEAASLIAEGEVSVDAEVVRTKSRRLEGGQLLALSRLAATGPSLPAAQPELPLTVLHEDQSVVVVDKPAGVVVHPAPGHRDGTLVNALLARYPDLAEVGDPQRPGIVHRLDRDTSGLMVVARTPSAYDGLVEDLSHHLVERRYVALVHGRPETPEGSIEAPVGRSRRDPMRMCVTQAGRAATTHYSLVSSWNDPPVSLLGLALETGRTHQIRVHLASVGWYVVGDPVYGRALAGHPLERPFLHAVELGFSHPVDGREVTFQSPLAPELQAVLRALGEPPETRTPS
ncbi:MAG: RluA family pseudouridine synthase [Microthrixaceae bacterium]